jgi:hypothetical protein
MKKLALSETKQTLQTGNLFSPQPEYKEALKKKVSRISSVCL